MDGANNMPLVISIHGIYPRWNDMRREQRDSLVNGLKEACKQHAAAYGLQDVYVEVAFDD